MDIVFGMMRKMSRTNEKELKREKEGETIGVEKMELKGNETVLRKIERQKAI